MLVGFLFARAQREGRMDLLTKDEKHLLFCFIAVVLTGMGLRIILATFPSTKRHISFIERSVLIPKTDLNRATYAELVALPKIGPQDAEALLSYRKAQGRFSSVAELKDVPGLSVKAWKEGSFFLEVR